MGRVIVDAILVTQTIYEDSCANLIYYSKKIFMMLPPKTISLWDIGIYFHAMPGKITEKTLSMARLASFVKKKKINMHI